MLCSASFMSVEKIRLKKNCDSFCRTVAVLMSDIDKRSIAVICCDTRFCTNVDFRLAEIPGHLLSRVLH